MKRTLSIVVLCLAGLSWDHSAHAGKRYALVVGVKSYRAGQPLPELAYAENDAVGLAAVLQAGGYDVTLMTLTVGRTEGKEVLAPLSDYIRDQLSAILDNPFLKEDDVVLVALAGHGVQYELVDDAGNKAPKFYFCPADADVARLKTANEITDRHRLLDLGELYASLKDCQAGGKLLLVDACRNDPTKPGLARTLASATLPPLPPPPGGTAAFFSCSAHQKAFEDQDLKHGVFFHHVIEALEGDADTSTAKRKPDGEITLSELSDYVSASTYDFVRTKFQGAKQAPELKGEFRVAIPLITAARMTPKPPAPMPTPSTSDVPRKPIVNSIGLTMRPILAGTFQMGSPQSDPSHRSDELLHDVRISRGFYLSAHEVTRGQFRQFVVSQRYQTDAERDGQGGWGFDPVGGTVGVTGSQFTWLNPGYTQTEEHPVVNVSYQDAVAFCRWLSGKEDRVYRLPTEAEWEYACRAGTSTRYAIGDSDSSLQTLGNVADRSLAAKSRVAAKWSQSWDDRYTFTSPVGSFEPNPWGLYDMHGNVWEWVQDFYDANYYRSSPAVDPPGPAAGEYRMFRGGGWFNPPLICRSANRNVLTAADRTNLIGFRVLMEMSP